MKRLYLHFPFCETRCHYCDFYALAKDRADAQEPKTFVQALRKELNLRLDEIESPIETIFMGGGTPSLTETDDLYFIFEGLLKSKSLAAQYEWTSECNPSSVTLDALKAMKHLGINRISLGTQAFQENLLKTLGRVHDRSAVFRATENLHAAGFDNFSIDLMCGIPGQSLKDLEESLNLALSTGIKHLSCYILTLAKHHPMYKDLPDEKTQLEHYLFLADFMKAHGFHHYEISNFAKPGFESKHNLAYWTGNSYLGLGPSAHSYDSKTQTRWKNVSSLKKYTQLISEQKLATEQVEHLNPDERFLERWMLALRLSLGFSKNWLKNYQHLVNLIKIHRNLLLI